ncbi:MAG: septum site-determining protein MinC [Bacillota bacterium]|nr:septum site-determining protein MinC [Bacillota bacterium]
MEEGLALLKVGGRLVIRIPLEGGWDRLVAVLQDLAEGGGEEVILDTGPLVLSARELVEVERILNARSYRLVRVVHGARGSPPAPRRRHSVPAGPVDPEAVQPGQRPAARVAAGETGPRTRGRVREPGERTLVRRGPLRSGQVIRYRGNVVIMGDVNPGAQVVATGDVIVLGALRGVAHAGADGSRNAVVAALRLCPTQLRIADLIRRAPEGDRGRVRPELARVRDAEIVVEGL